MGTDFHLALLHWYTLVIFTSVLHVFFQPLIVQYVMVHMTQYVAVMVQHTAAYVTYVVKPVLGMCQWPLCILDLV